MISFERVKTENIFLCLLNTKGKKTVIKSRYVKFKSELLSLSDDEIIRKRAEALNIGDVFFLVTFEGARTAKLLWIIKFNKLRKATVSI